MNANRLWVLGTVVLAIGIVAIGWLVGVQPKLAEAAQAESDRLDAVAANAQNELVLAELKKQYESLGEIEAELAELQLAVPFKAELPRFLDELEAIAASTGGAVADIRITEARFYGSAPTAEPVPAEVPAEGETEGAPEEAPVAAPEPATTTPVSPVAYSDVRISASNFVAIPVTVNVNGDYAAIMRFVAAAQSMERLYLVNNLSIQPMASTVDDGTEAFTALLGGFVYVLLDPIAEATAAG